MKNQIYTVADDDGKFAAFLYRYHEKPSGSITPILMVSGKHIFQTEQEAAEHLFNALPADVQEYTEIAKSGLISDTEIEKIDSFGQAGK